MTPTSAANPVTMNTPVTGVALTSAPYSVSPTDETIAYSFTPGTQAANDDFKDVAYILKLTTGGTDYYRKASNVVSLPHMGGLAANTTDAVVADGSDLFYNITSATKWVTSHSGNDADSAGSAVPLVDGTAVTLDVLAVNKDQNGVHNSGTASGDAKTATTSGVPDAPVVVVARTGSLLGGSDADMSGNVMLRVKLTDAGGFNSADNGSAILKIGFKLTGANGGVTDFTGNAAIEVSTTDTSLFYGTSATSFYDYTVGSLNNGEEYTLSELSFFNANGEGLDYDGSTITATPSTLATWGVASGTGSPADLTKSTLNAGEISVSWPTPSSDGGSAITGYIILHSVNSDMSSPTTVTNIAANATSYTITGLPNGTKRYVTLYAQNSNGSSAALPIVKSGGDPANTTDKEFTPSGYPDMTQVPNIATTNALTTGDTFNSISFTIDPNSAIDTTPGSAYNNGYSTTHVRAYLVVAGAEAGASASTSKYIDVAFADLATPQTITPSAGMITAASAVSGSNQGKYYIKTYLINQVYGTSEADILAGTGQVAQKSGADMYVSFYDNALSFTSQPAMTLSNTVDGNGDFNGTKMSISWTVSEFGTSSSLNTVPLSSFDVIVSECAPIADGTGLIAYPQADGQDDYTALNVSSLTGLSGANTTGVISVSGTTRTYTLELATSDAAPVYYGFKYKVEVTAKSSANGTIKTLAANALTDSTPANKPTVSVAVDSPNNQVDITVLPNGSAMDDSFLLTPGASGAGTEVQDFSASLAVANGVYAGGNPPFNQYIPNGGSRASLSSLSRSASNLAANISSYLVISENGEGASIVLNGSPLSSLANPA